jgi:hypothetical protein
MDVKQTGAKPRGNLTPCRKAAMDSALDEAGVD